MALIKCKECGKEISTQAASCPHCGAVRFVPKTKAKTSGCTWLVLVVLGVPVLIAIFAGSSGQRSTTPQPSAESPTAPNLLNMTPAEREATMKKLRDEARGKNWEVSRGTSSRDDSPTVTISTPAQNFARNVIGLPTVPRLWVRCMENQTDVIVSIEGAYLNNDPIPVSTRIDKHASERTTWSMSTGHDAVLRRNPIAFVRRLVASESLWVELTPYGQNPVSFTFATDGLDLHIGELQRACKWK